MSFFHLSSHIPGVIGKIKKSKNILAIWKVADHIFTQVLCMRVIYLTEFSEISRVRVFVRLYKIWLSRWRLDFFYLQAGAIECNLIYKQNRCWGEQCNRSVNLFLRADATESEKANISRVSSHIRLSVYVYIEIVRSERELWNIFTIIGMKKNWAQVITISEYISLWFLSNYGTKLAHLR